MPSLLIVDDLISIHEMLEAVIQPTGYKTAFATDGEKGLARYKAEKYDLVLADIDMKPMDGITLLKQLKLYDPGAVVIIMTAYASTESAVQALKFGAFDYLQKPFRVDELIATRERERPAGSYTTKLFEAGTRRIAQKVGEEGVETALAAVSQDDSALLGEAADLVYHLLVLLRARGLGLDDLATALQSRT